ncbi:PREDICTED: stigma-specific STIG1-like protein 3 [Tarenaya hassleriana]|uniref:stigma-specific STIG1-like protein 3 n=1 Tax=Tarenaya hassleriana TaxID=28532 RepID=UPI00053C4382|nr:PREDICTED: stigma-specific STIG1-like protein 3 [Tarenaya hassleriana]
MGLTKILLVLALTTAITIALPMTFSNNKDDKNSTFKQQIQTQTPHRNARKVSRFLAEKGKPLRNPNAADHCNKNEEICKRQGGGNNYNSTMSCCNNKCVNLSYDNDNCGACNNQCKFTQTCCRGECVYLAYDKRHCGECNHRCQVGELCVYGLCNYA